MSRRSPVNSTAMIQVALTRLESALAGISLAQSAPDSGPALATGLNDAATNIGLARSALRHAIGGE